MEYVFLKSPSNGEIKEVEATIAVLTPLMAHGWHQVPAPAKPTVEPTPAPVEVKTVEAPVAPEQIKETEDK